MSGIPNPLADLAALMAKQEPLCDELAACVSRRGSFLALHHRLMVEAPYFPGMNAVYNERYRAIKRRFDECVEAGDWNSATWLTARPYRIELLIEHGDRMDEPTYWGLLGDVIVDSENLWQYRKVIRALVTPAHKDVRGRLLMMDPEERAWFESLPDTVTAYRGCLPHNRRGWCWTLDETQALWFARRFHRQQGLVLTASIDKADIIAVFQRRERDEVFIDPACPRVIKTTKAREYPARRADPDGPKGVHP